VYFQDRKPEKPKMPTASIKGRSQRKKGVQLDTPRTRNLLKTKFLRNGGKCILETREEDAHLCGAKSTPKKSPGKPKTRRSIPTRRDLPKRLAKKPLGRKPVEKKHATIRGTEKCLTPLSKTNRKVNSMEGGTQKKTEIGVKQEMLQEEKSKRKQGETGTNGTSSR